MDPRPEVVALDPHTLGEVLGDVRTLAQATDAKDAGVALVQEAARRIDRVRLAVRGAEPVRVAALEWLDPVFVAGHWTPQLIEYAGGIDVLGLPGEPSETRTWEEVIAAEPEVVVVHALRLRRRARARRGRGVRGRARRRWAPRGSSPSTPPAYFSRPGPRLVDGLELLGAHPPSRPRARGAAARRSSSRSSSTPRAAASLASRKRRRARSIDSSASSRGYQPSTLTTFHSGVL